MKRTERWVPSEEQMALWPAVSGNVINGVGEPDVRRPTPVYWHAPDATPHGRLQTWFLNRITPVVQAARVERQSSIDLVVPPVSDRPLQQSAEAWSADVKAAALASDADIVGITRMQYGRGIRAAKGVATFLHERGHYASPHGGPMAFPMLLVPAAIAAGLGELGKHGSLINRTLGSNLRLACVLTDLPLVADEPDNFGAADFCQRCVSCTNACPPEAIQHEQRMVRGEMRWYVDFDRCLPFFNEHQGCAVCLAVCPWNLPGVADTLVSKMALVRARQ